MVVHQVVAIRLDGHRLSIRRGEVLLAAVARPEILGAYVHPGANGEVDAATHGGRLLVTAFGIEVLIPNIVGPRQSALGVDAPGAGVQFAVLVSRRLCSAPVSGLRLCADGYGCGEQDAETHSCPSAAERRDERFGSFFADRYAVSYAANGKKGMEKALELVPDLIITDLMMPGMDGLEVCRQVRENEIVNHIPIIVVTAKITEEERIRGLEAGADAYLSKPFNADELRTRVEKLLDGRRLLREKFAQMMTTHQDDEKEAIPQRSAADLRFLAKVSDVIYLQLNRGKEVEVSQIASAICMSGRQFYRKINALTNDTPTVYIQRVKIKKAKSLLDGDAQMSFGEIADRCGFNDYSNFVRTFKNAYGVTPTEYRRGNAANV